MVNNDHSRSLPTSSLETQARRPQQEHQGMISFLQQQQQHSHTGSIAGVTEAGVGGTGGASTIASSSNTQPTGQDPNATMNHPNSNQQQRMMLEMIQKQQQQQRQFQMQQQQQNNPNSYNPNNQVNLTMAGSSGSGVSNGMTMQQLQQHQRQLQQQQRLQRQQPTQQQAMQSPLQQGIPVQQQQQQQPNQRQQQASQQQRSPSLSAGGNNGPVSAAQPMASPLLFGRGGGGGTNSNNMKMNVRMNNNGGSGGVTNNGEGGPKSTSSSTAVQQRFMVDDFAGAGTLLSARTAAAAAAAQDAQQKRQAELFSHYAAVTGGSETNNGNNSSNNSINNQNPARLRGPIGAGGGGGTSGSASNNPSAPTNFQEHKLNELLFAKQLGIAGMNPNAAAAAAAAGLGGISNLGLIGGAGFGGLLSPSSAGGLNGVGFQHQQPQQSQQQQQLKTTRLPCQARGMKADHNASTAYFEIPDDARHGQHLLCSHPACRSAGVKFRYCYYCKKPVTKQNFRSRHLHADLDPNKSDGPNVTAAITNKVRRSSGGPNNGPTKRRSPNPSLGLPSTMCQPCDDSDEHTGTDEIVRPKKQMRSSIKEEHRQGGDKEEPSRRSVTEYNVSRRSHWRSLLDRRPSDPSMIHVWIRDVVVGSDPKTHFNISDENDGQQDAAGFRGDWMELLTQRPTTSGVSDAAFNQWLSNVIRMGRSNN
eukprot:CAMPEP_0113482200 /NCGR_PEP_ID=MMETSP0014_2-20120614/22796_1 /TAXON_ID=2857 /ORGANISM="Nitzschia sp." /LENGTH=699 /DNA_ID=CAMNT_0000375709 /DNA_START=307 /DNA_END=2406 /DNA_ORIENTATION=- /assembly_acc=CAM_ASM_000159